MTRQENGIDHLIKRIRDEAIDKADNERDDILKRAEADARALLDKARDDAARFLDDARAQLQREQLKFAKDMEMAARDFTLKLSERLKEQLLFPAIRENVRVTVREPHFLKQVLERLIVEFVKTNPCNLDVLVPKELKTTLATYFAGAIFDSLDKNCDVRLVDENGIEGFALIKRGEHYVWDFRVDTIAQELSRLVEPSLRKYFTANTNPARVVASDSTKSAAMAQ